MSRSIGREDGGTIAAVDRSKIPSLLHQVGLEREHAGSELEGDIVARQLSADDFVSGRLSVAGDEVTIYLELYSVDSDQPIERLEASFILDPEKEKLLNTDVHDTPQGAYPFAGSDGYSMPECKSCPNVQFSDEAVKKKVQGEVDLLAVITADGKVTNIHVLKGLPSQLTDLSVKTVENWQYKPAVDANGTPAPVRDLVEVVFHLY